MTTWLAARDADENGGAAPFSEPAEPSRVSDTIPTTTIAATMPTRRGQNLRAAGGRRFPRAEPVGPS